MTFRTFSAMKKLLIRKYCVSSRCAYGASPKVIKWTISVSGSSKARLVSARTSSSGSATPVPMKTRCPGLSRATACGAVLMVAAYFSCQCGSKPVLGSFISACRGGKRHAGISNIRFGADFADNHRVDVEFCDLRIIGRELADTLQRAGDGFQVDRCLPARTFQQRIAARAFEHLHRFVLRDGREIKRHVLHHFDEN